MDGLAEQLLRRLQQQLLDGARSAPFAAEIVKQPRQAVKDAERRFGPAATQCGRRLQELLAGSPAWSLFERPRPRNARAPHIPELSRCGPLLKIMRESGELDERESLLRERDEALISIWQDSSVAGLDKEHYARAAYEHFAAEIAKLRESYRPYYRRLRRAMATIAPLAMPRVRVRTFLQPPLMTHLFRACHADESEFESYSDETGSGLSYGSGQNSIRIRRSPQPENSAADPLAGLSVCSLGSEGPGDLDEMTWDIAAIAVSAFFVRTDGDDPSDSYPLLIDDYFDWRGVDLRKRTQDLRRRIDERIRLLCSDALQIDAETALWLPSAGGTRRTKTQLKTQGSFLVRESAIYRPSIWQSEAEDEPSFGYLVSLGEWAHRLVRERAMIGVFPKRLAEYDLRRQQWERRIGWYLTFQMHNQASRMTFQETVEDGAPTVLRVTPQHPLRMRTVLDNSQVHWREMARTNPGKVIKQWIDALETLSRDGIIDRCDCMDGAADGSDLPARSRLAAMLEYRFEFTPGADLIGPLRAKAARRSRRT